MESDLGEAAKKPILAVVVDVTNVLVLQRSTPVAAERSPSAAAGDRGPAEITEHVARRRLHGVVGRPRVSEPKSVVEPDLAKVEFNVTIEQLHVYLCRAQIVERERMSVISDLDSTSVCDDLCVVGAAC